MSLVSFAACDDQPVLFAEADASLVTGDAHHVKEPTLQWPQQTVPKFRHVSSTAMSGTTSNARNVSNTAGPPFTSKGSVSSKGPGCTQFFDAITENVTSKD